MRPSQVFWECCRQQRFQFNSRLHSTHSLRSAIQQRTRRPPRPRPHPRPYRTTQSHACPRCQSTPTSRRRCALAGLLLQARPHPPPTSPFPRLVAQDTTLGGRELVEGKRKRRYVVENEPAAARDGGTEGARRGRRERLTENAQWTVSSCLPGLLLPLGFLLQKQSRIN